MSADGRERIEACIKLLALDHKAPEPFCRAAMELAMVMVVASAEQCARKEDRKAAALLVAYVTSLTHFGAVAKLEAAQTVGVVTDALRMSREHFELPEFFVVGDLISGART